MLRARPWLPSGAVRQHIGASFRGFNFQAALTTKSDPEASHGPASAPMPVPPISLESPRLRPRLGKAAWVLFLGVYGLGFAAAGFYATASPVGGMLLAKFGLYSDQESLRQYVPEDREARAVEEFIQNHSLTAELRAKENFAESRPHMKLPLPFRRRNLTAGTLLGPGRIAVPPLAWIDDGKSLVSISYLGPDLCGHPGIVHGGILATMLDEGMARCCWDALPRKMAVTANLEVNYRKPALAGNYVVLRAETVAIEGRKAWVKGRIETLAEPGQEPQLLAEASGLFISPKSSTVSPTMAWA